MLKWNDRNTSNTISGDCIAFKSIIFMFLKMASVMSIFLKQIYISSRVV